MRIKKDKAKNVNVLISNPIPTKDFIEAGEKTDDINNEANKIKPAKIKPDFGIFNSPPTNRDRNQNKIAKSPIISIKIALLMSIETPLIGRKKMGIITPKNKIKLDEILSKITDLFESSIWQDYTKK